MFVDVGASLTISDLRLSGVPTEIEAKNSGDVQIDRVAVEAEFAGIEVDSPGADLRLDGTFVDGHAQQVILVNRADAVVLVDSTARNNGSEGLKATDLTTSIGSASFVAVHPCLAEPPLASSLNHVAGVNRANELIASVDSDGNICLFTSRAIHLVVDVVGFLPTGSTFSAIPPARFLDMRSTGETVDRIAQREGTVAAGDEYELQITGRPGVPDTATAVVVNVTAAGPDSRGFVTVHPCVDPPPNASSLNYVAGVNGANELITQLDADGKLCLFTNEPVDLIVDVVGWLS